MKKHYQLFRNTLRIKSKNDYFVCLYPKDNTIAESHFVHFKDEYISPNMTSHVLKVHWEDLGKRMRKPFKEKFFDF